MDHAVAEPTFDLDGKAASTIEGLRFLPAGDRFVLLELGQRMELPLNLRAIQLADRLLEEGVEGLIETLPMFISVLVHYDSLVLGPERLKDVVGSVWRDLVSESDVLVPSRLIEIPVHYLDPWTKECVEDYSRNIHPIEYNPAYVARINGLSGPEALVRLHSSTQHWVGGVGFWAGVPDMLPLDPRCVLSIPKYNPPRLWTVQGAIGVGGGFTSIYPIVSPGGYHLIGRTPVPIYSLDTRLAPFRERAVLCQPGDRIKFRPVSLEEYESIAAEAEAGTYRYLIWDYDLFSLSRYLDWAEGLGTRADAPVEGA
jgi:KipI family sensor histidine kinase inhibitor